MTSRLTAAQRTHQTDMARWRRGAGPKPTLPPYVQREDWMGDGNCHGMTTDDMFPGQGEGTKTRAAKAVCVGCPVLTDCLEYALGHNERHGVWGGTSERERRRIRTARRMAS